MSRTAIALGLLLVVALAAGCGRDEGAERDRIPGTPEAQHVIDVGRNPYLVTCRDLRRQPLHPESQKLVIRAEFALGRVPELRRLARRITDNRAGRSVYYGLTEECKGRPGSFRPAHAAVKGVLSGKYRAARNRPG
jgi:hypothetical protein